MPPQTRSQASKRKNHDDSQEHEVKKHKKDSADHLAHPAHQQKVDILPHSPFVNDASTFTIPRKIPPKILYEAFSNALGKDLDFNCNVNRLRGIVGFHPGSEHSFIGALYIYDLACKLSCLHEIIRMEIPFVLKQRLDEFKQEIKSVLLGFEGETETYLRWCRLYHEDYDGDVILWAQMRALETWEIQSLQP